MPSVRAATVVVLVLALGAIGRVGAIQSTAPAAPPQVSAAKTIVSYWQHVKSGNVMRLEEHPSGEMRFWAHWLNGEDAPTRRYFAVRGLQIDPARMTPADVLKFCGFGYENGLKYAAIESRPGDQVFQAVLAIGFDFFRSVENPKYGNTRWRIRMWRPNAETLRIEGRLIGWRGFLMFGQVRDQADLVRLPNPPAACRA